MKFGKHEEENPEAPEADLTQEAEEGAPEAAPDPAPEPVHPAMLAARDGAQVCALINRAIQEGENPDLPAETLQEIRIRAAALAERAHGLRQALDNGALEAAEPHSPTCLGSWVGTDALAELWAAVILAARDELQSLLGQATAVSEAV